MAPEDRTGIEERLAQADSQLALYARDLRAVVDAEREKARQLALANARLERLLRLKSDFLAFVSHELRTPLNAMSVVDLLESGADPEQQSDVIEILRSGYGRLQSLVEKGLEYFQWLAFEEPPASDPVDLAAVVREAVASTPELARLDVDFRIDGEAAFRVQGDAAALRAVFETLLSNAVKFSEGAPVCVRVRLDVAGETGTLAVSDRGRGFPPELAPELVEPFTVLDSNHHSKGTGLSLALAAAIAGAHGGRLTAESPGPGRGATFRLILPALAGVAGRV